MVKLLQAVAAFLNVFIYLLYVFRAEPTTMQRQLTGVSKPRWGGSSQHMEAYRYPIEFQKARDSDQLTMNAGYLHRKNQKCRKKDDGIKRLVTRLIGNPQLSRLDFLRGVTISKWTRKII